MRPCRSWRSGRCGGAHSPHLPSVIARDWRMRDAQRSWLVRFFSVFAASALFITPVLPVWGADPSGIGKAAPIKAARIEAAPAKAAPADEQLAVFTKAAPESVDDLVKMEQ